MRGTKGVAWKRKRKGDSHVTGSLTASSLLYLESLNRGVAITNE